MKTTLRFLILLSIVFVIGASMVPFEDSYAVTVDLNQVPSLATTAYAITPYLGFIATLSLIPSAIGLFFIRGWSRPLSKLATFLASCFATLTLLFNPLIGAVPSLATALLSAAALTWIAVIWLSHSKSLDAQFLAAR